jgi:hypothetical protein
MEDHLSKFEILYAEVENLEIKIQGKMGYTLTLNLLRIFTDGPKFGN